MRTELGPRRRVVATLGKLSEQRMSFESDAVAIFRVVDAGQGGLGSNARKLVNGLWSDKIDGRSGAL
jgi:hypothetical protein